MPAAARYPRRRQHVVNPSLRVSSAHRHHSAHLPLAHPFRRHHMHTSLAATMRPVPWPALHPTPQLTWQNAYGPNPNVHPSPPAHDHVRHLPWCASPNPRPHPRMAAITHPTPPAPTPACPPRSQRIPWQSTTPRAPAAATCSRDNARACRTNTKTQTMMPPDVSPIHAQTSRAPPSPRPFMQWGGLQHVLPVYATHEHAPHLAARRGALLAANMHPHTQLCQLQHVHEHVSDCTHANHGHACMGCACTRTHTSARIPVTMRAYNPGTHT